MTFYDTVRAAIRTAILAVDPTIRVYDYETVPVDTSADKFSKMFGIIDASGNPIVDSTGSYINNFVRFFRSVPGLMGEVHSTGRGADGKTLNEVRQVQSEWQIEYYRTFQDPVNDPSGKLATPSEYLFQDTIDNIKRELYLNSVITSLMTLAGFNGAVMSVNASQQRLGDFPGSKILHHGALLTLTMSHLQSRLYT
jgi:hypothetical protein